jgi:hypothetical protein
MGHLPRSYEYAARGRLAVTAITFKRDSGHSGVRAPLLALNC